MKRLCTKEASRKNMHYILLLAWLIYIPYIFFQYGLNQAFFVNLGFASLLLGIFEVVVLCIWYPKERLHKKAIEQGEVYEGKITRYCGGGNFCCNTVIYRYYEVEHGFESVETK